MSISCIIVDDEPLAVKLLESYVARTPYLALQASFTDSVSAISCIKERPCDLVFLDIQMPDLNGMELAEMIPTQTRIIFTTAFKEYAYDSYGVNALDFLLKPIRYQKFLAATEKAKWWFEHFSEAVSKKEEEKSSLADSDSIYINVDRQLVQVRFDDILYVQGMKDYVVYFLENSEAVGNKDKTKTLITHMTMSTVEEVLPKSKFMRVNRSYIVAINKIRSFDRNNCIYIGNEIIHVTDAYLTEFNKYIRAKIANKD